MFDYTLHYDLQNAAQRSSFDRWRGTAHLEGEPFRCMFRPGDVIALCSSIGFSEVRTTSLEALNSLYCTAGGNGLRIESINQLAYVAVR